jgi:hypothetical protein
MPQLSSFENDSLWERRSISTGQVKSEHDNNNDNNKKKLRRSRKSVTFAVSCRVRILVDNNNNSNESINNIMEQQWLQPQDYETIRQDRCASLDRIIRGTYSNQNDCFRGLEGRTPWGAYQKRNNRNKAWDAVFLEQDFQWKSGITNPEILSIVYYRCSRICQENAALRGLQDQKAVERANHVGCWSSSFDRGR